MRIFLIDETPDGLIQLTQIKRSAPSAVTGSQQGSQYVVVALPGPLGLGQEDQDVEYEVGRHLLDVLEARCLDGGSRSNNYRLGSVRRLPGES